MVESREDLNSRSRRILRAEQAIRLVNSSNMNFSDKLSMLRKLQDMHPKAAYFSCFCKSSNLEKLLLETLKSGIENEQVIDNVLFILNSVLCTKKSHKLSPSCSFYVIVVLMQFYSRCPVSFFRILNCLEGLSLHCSAGATVLSNCTWMANCLTAGFWATLNTYCFKYCYGWKDRMAAPVTKRLDCARLFKTSLWVCNFLASLKLKACEPFMISNAGVITFSYLYLIGVPDCILPNIQFLEKLMIKILDMMGLDQIDETCISLQSLVIWQAVEEVVSGRGQISSHLRLTIRKRLFEKVILSTRINPRNREDQARLTAIVRYERETLKEYPDALRKLQICVESILRCMKEDVFKDCSDCYYLMKFERDNMMQESLSESIHIYNSDVMVNKYAYCCKAPCSKKVLFMIDDHREIMFPSMPQPIGVPPVHLATKPRESDLEKYAIWGMPQLIPNQLTMAYMDKVQEAYVRFNVFNEHDNIMKLDVNRERVSFILSMRQNDGANGLLRLFGFGSVKDKFLAIVRKGYLEETETVRVVCLNNRKVLCVKAVGLLKNTTHSKIVLSKTYGFCAVQAESHKLRIVRLCNNKVIDYDHSAVIDGFNMIDSLIAISSTTDLHIFNITPSMIISVATLAHRLGLVQMIISLPANNSILLVPEYGDCGARVSLLEPFEIEYFSIPGLHQHDVGWTKMILRLNDNECLMLRSSEKEENDSSVRVCRLRIV